MKDLKPIIKPVKPVPTIDIKPKEMGKRMRKTLKQIEGAAQ
jgi:hypothetical protein